MPAIVATPRRIGIIVDRARLEPEGTELPGESWGGFLVEVGDDVGLTLSVRRLEDSEI